MITFREEDARRMRAIQEELVRVLAPHAEKTEAALAAFALMRCARALLRKYPKGTQRELVRVCQDYLEGRATPRDGGEPLLVDATGDALVM